MTVLRYLACPFFAFVLLLPEIHAQEPEAIDGNAALEEAAAGGESVGEQAPHFILGTGGLAGSYYPIGRLLGERSGLSIAVEATSGSTENLVRLRAGDFDLAIAQSDRVAQARLGLPPFQEDEPDGRLRTVMSLFPEPLIIITRADSGLEDLENIGDATVNLAPVTHPMRALFHLVLDAHNVPQETIANAAEIPLPQQGEALCSAEVDVIAYVAASPSGTINQVANMCEIAILPITGAEADLLVRGDHALTPAVVPGGLYPGVDKDVPTVATVATLVALDTLDAAAVESIVITALAEMDVLRESHPAWRHWSPEFMQATGAPAPLHAGAVSVFGVGAAAEARGEVEGD